MKSTNVVKIGPNIVLQYYRVQDDLCRILCLLGKLLKIIPRL